MGSRARTRLRRFGLTERAAHWLLAVTFFAMLFTGLCLSVSAFQGILDRPTAKAWHLWSAIALAVGLVLVVLLGDRRALARSARQIDRFDADDAEWLKGGPRRVWNGRPAPPQGRFNAGQKLNASLIGGLMLAMYATGGLLWYGERDTSYRFAGTVMVHDWATLFLMLLVAGHLYLAVLHPATRHALRGMTLGDVDEDWARRHHAKWVESAAAGAPAPPAAPETPPRRPAEPARTDLL
ncbi:MAG TPA: cytochrome b/b6 domain-containing protein [Gaiellales bacterium]|jgi:formate dehydrogenase subunit gamma